jgi:hypothetical protein
MPFSFELETGCRGRFELIPLCGIRSPNLCSLKPVRIQTGQDIKTCAALSARCSLFSVKVAHEILEASVDGDRCDGTARPQFLGQLQRGSDVQSG